MEGEASDEMTDLVDVNIRKDEPDSKVVGEMKKLAWLESQLK